MIKLLKTPDVRDMDNGDVVVDYGSKWFRCSPNGRVIAKIAEGGRVVIRPATRSEKLLALGDAAFGPVVPR